MIRKDNSHVILFFEPSNYHSVRAQSGIPNDSSQFLALQPDFDIIIVDECDVWSAKNHVDQ